MGEVRYRGRVFTEGEINEVREVVATHRDKSRWFISRELCRRWKWVQPNGVLKDIICRGFLLQLARQGRIELPPCRKDTPYRLAHAKKPLPVQIDQTPLEEKLFDLRPIELFQVRRTPFQNLYNSLIEQFHYLGYTRPVGEHLEYLAFSRGRVLACLGWCSAPRHIGCRDRYLGWSPQQRIKNLCRVVTNTRFLILPRVRVPHLASHLLGKMARRLSSDWKKSYRHEVVWLETFVDPERGFSGTSYKAANWIYLGQTTGRGKADQTGKANRSLKAVWGYPLKRNFSGRSRDAGRLGNARFELKRSNG